MSKKTCWFSHDFTKIVGFGIEHIGGKVCRAPETRSVMQRIQCNSCDHVREIFFKEVNSNLANSEVKELNEKLGKLHDPVANNVTITQAIDFI